MMQGLRGRTKSQKMFLVLQAMGLVCLMLLFVPLFSEGSAQVLFLGAIAAGIGIVVIIEKPHWGVAILLLRFLVGDIPWLPGASYFKMAYAIGVVLFIPLALSILRDREIWVLRVPQVLIFLGIGSLFLASTWWSSLMQPVTPFPEADYTKEYTLGFFVRLLFLIFFLYFITTRQRIEGVIWLVVGVITIAAVSAFYPVLTGEEMGRASATFSTGRNANRLAFTCLFATSLLWFYRAHGSMFLWKTVTLPLLFLLPATALSAGSRSGLLLTIVLVVLILNEQKGWMIARRIQTILIMGIVGFFLLSVVPNDQLMRATNLDPTKAARGQQSSQNRLSTIKTALEITISHPIFGVGLGNFPWVKQAVYGIPDRTKTHNAYLWAFVEGGVGVFVLYVMLFSLTYRMLRQLEEGGPRELLWLSKGLRVSLILFLLFSLSTDFWLSDYPYLFVGLTVAMTSVWRRQSVSRVNSEIPPSAAVFSHTH